MPKNKQELFHQVSVKLFQMIAGGKFRNGRLPPEDRLADELEISRITIRDILGNLEANGYILRKKGVGTIINKHAFKAQIRLDINQFFPEHIKSAGYQPKVILKSMDFVAPPLPAQEHLGVSPEDSIMRIEKLFFADNMPFIYLNTYLTREQASRLINCGQMIPSVEKSTFETSRSILDSCLPPMEIAQELEISQSKPVLHVLVDGYDLHGQTVIFSDEYFRTDIIHLTVFQKILPEKNDVFFYYDDKT